MDTAKSISAWACLGALLLTGCYSRAWHCDETARIDQIIGARSEPAPAIMLAPAVPLARATMPTPGFTLEPHNQNPNRARPRSRSGYGSSGSSWSGSSSGRGRRTRVAAAY